MSTPDWTAWQFLLGEWVGEGGGQPGQGQSVMKFNFDLQKQVILRTSHMDFISTPERPAFAHDDLTIIYPDSSGALRAVYFDNEGHVIHYRIYFDQGNIVFISDAVPTEPRFRTSYFKGVNETVITRFEIAPPGNPDAFNIYVEGTVKRKLD